MNPLARRIMSVLWPAFLMAGLLEMAVFALVEPGSLRWFGGAALELSETAVYSFAFLLFWAVIALAGALVLLLDRATDEVNAPTGTTRRQP